jgi:hypothetical protein
VNSGYGNSVWNGRLVLTVTVATGYFVDAPGALVLRVNDEIVTVGLEQPGRLSSAW